MNDVPKDPLDICVAIYLGEILIHPEILRPVQRMSLTCYATSALTISIPSSRIRISTDVTGVLSFIIALDATAFKWMRQKIQGI